MPLQGKTVFLTGAAGGIGAALAAQLHEQQAQLVLIGRNAAALNALNIRLGGRHTVLLADIATADGIAAIIRAAEQRPSGVDLLINNAGVSHFGLLPQQQDIAQQIAINLSAPIALCQGLLPSLERACGTIVNIGSTFGSIGYPGFSSYCASKFGLRGFSQALRRELAESPVNVLYIAPRATNTAINNDAVVAMNSALGNAVDEPAAVATQILAAITRANKHETYIGWPEKLFVKINALLPALVDGSLRKQLATIVRFSTGEKP